MNTFGYGVIRWGEKKNRNCEVMMTGEAEGEYVKIKEWKDDGHSRKWE